MEKIRQKILIKYPFLTGPIERARFINTDSLLTIGTDGKDIFYNPDYLHILTEDEQVFVFTHGICHIAFNHVFKRKDKEPTVWNMATDAVINAYLKADNLKPVKYAFYMPQAINYDTDEFYRILIQQGVGEKIAEEYDYGTRFSGKDIGHDTHHLWKAVIANKEKYDEIEAVDDIDNCQPGIGEWEIPGEIEAFTKNALARAALLDDMLDLLAEQVVEVGDSTNSDIREVGSIGNAQALINWRMVLKDAISVEVDWSSRNTEIEDGVLKSNLIDIPKPETEILLDTSGSIDAELLKNFLRECKNLLQVSKVKVGCFDTEFYGFKEINSDKDIDNMEFVGGGGTDFNTAVGAFSRKVENKIIFTDGEADMPEKPSDAIWIVFGDKKIKPKGGRVIEIAEEQLNRRKK